MPVTATPSRPAPATLDQLDPRLRGLCDAYLMQGGAPGGSIAIVAADHSYHYAYGRKAIGKPEAVTATTGFNVGSCSKAFVSATIASLVAEGLVQWDDPISRWVPEFQLYDAATTAEVRLRDVCANRLGLPRIGLTEYGFKPEVPVERILSALKHTAPIHPLRDRFTYVNPGHTAAALAAGRITGKGFLPTLRERLLDPLGMTSTSGGIAALTELDNRAGWHIRDGDEVVAIEPQYTDNYLGSGGMVVSGVDALQWLRFQLNGGTLDGKQVIPRDALIETHRPHAVATPGKDIVSLFYPEARMASYALAWAVSDFEGHPLICHSGSDHGITAMTILLPRAGIGIAVYVNAWSGSTMPLAYAIAATLLGLPPRDWLAYFRRAGHGIGLSPPPASDAVETPTLPTASYAGVFLHPADGEMRITADGSGLSGVIVDGYAMSFRLVSLGGDSFAMQFTERPTRLAMHGYRLAFDVTDGHTTSVAMHAPPDPARFFVRQ